MSGIKVPKEIIVFNEEDWLSRQGRSPRLFVELGPWFFSLDICLDGSLKFTLFLKQ